MRPTATHASDRNRSRTSVLLWIVQGLLALLFLFAGGMKFVMPVSAMTAQSPVQFSGAFIHFIGLAEMLGALGLILPGLTRIRTGLTPLAAAGLVIIMIGATVVTLQGPERATALVPFVTGILAASVAFGRWKYTPIRVSRPTVLQPAR
jgi:uncharacterized membrane protein YphA (DoxX/SURF4 family)